MPHSELASPSATRAVMDSYGLATRKRLGQHFLIDDNVVGRILTLADLRGDEVVCEVGPGIGTLTVALCRQAGAVVAVERDAALVPALESTTASCSRFALVLADALDVTPGALGRPFGAPDALVANLPYQVAATVVLRFFELLPQLSHATVMVQAEVAERMAAEPGTKAYGAYTVKLRLFARPAGRFSVARGCFLPPPRVDSTVIRLDRAPLASDPVLLERAARVADAAFAQRRKTIRNSLRAALGAPDELIDEALAQAGFDPLRRAETYAAERYVDLAQAFEDAAGESHEFTD